MEQARALRRRLVQVGQAVVEVARASDAARWIRSHYVTAKSNHQDQWVAWLKSEVADRDVLTLLAHPHFVLPQDGNEPWAGVNIEFSGPRAVLRDAISNRCEEIVACVRAIADAQVWVVKKSVLPNDHRIYYWEHEQWRDRSPTTTAGFTDAEARVLSAIIDDPAPPPSPRTDHVTEPAIVFAWPLRRRQVTDWGDNLATELVARFATAAPLLRCLAGD